MTAETIIVTITLLYIVIAFILERMRPGLILFSAAVIFLATGVISADEMIAGFSNNGILTIAVLFLVNEGIKQSGLITKLAQAYLPRKKNPMMFLLPRIMIPAALFSAFLNNMPMVVNISPILIKWASVMKISYKKFLIPLSYAAIFGGMCTLIGTTSNLVVHGLMQENGFQGFHLFELGKLGLIISGAGFLYMSVFGNWLLPGKKIRVRKEVSDVRDYYYNLKLTENSSFAGQMLSGNYLPGLSGLYIQSIERNGKTLYPDRQPVKLFRDDDLLVAGNADRLNYILFHKDVRLKGFEFPDKVNPTELKQYEVVLSPRFKGLGLTVTEYNFYEHLEAVVLAIHRNGERITANLDKLKLKVGDNVVLLSTKNFINSWGNSQMFYLVNYVQDLKIEKTSGVRWIALFILLGMVLAIVVNEIVSWGYGMRLNIFLFVGIAALLLLWLKVLPFQNYTNHISWDLIISVASAFAIGKAIMNSGIADSMAHDAVHIVRSIGPVGVLAIIYLITSMLTETITNNAAVALVFPVAMVAARLLGVDEKPFFVAIAIAGASSFMTARGYRTNLIIKSAGNYSHGDFLKIGAPLQIMSFIISIIFIPYFWEF